MENKNKPATMPDKIRPRQKEQNPDQRQGKTTKGNGQYNEDPDKPVEITDDPEGTKQKIPSMKS